jgi:hypothetical protein
MLTTPECPYPTENPDKKPPLTVAESILLKAFITKINRKGDKGSSYFKPQDY